jgi:hypothetical protein
MIWLHVRTAKYGKYRAREGSEVGGGVRGLDVCVCVGLYIYKLHFGHKMCLWFQKIFRVKKLPPLKALNDTEVDTNF